MMDLNYFIGMDKSALTKSIDSAYKAGAGFLNSVKRLRDSCLYFLANDLKLFGSGNEHSRVVVLLKQHLDPSLSGHKQLQEKLVSFILRNGWVGYSKI